MDPDAATSFPGGRRFAFTILDDTDDATVENVAPVYEALCDLGFRTTKTVWVNRAAGDSIYRAGHTLQEPEYLAYVRSLHARGFELAWHGASMESSTRAQTVAALDWFLREFGFVPRLHANHGQNAENVYWGPERYRHPLLQRVARLGARPTDPIFSGMIPESPYFWGDLCRKHFDYVRNLTFHGIDVRRFDPQTPYRLDATPYVNHWFSTTDAPDVSAFNRRITPAALDRLAATGGVCIVSTHLGKGFAPGGRLDPTFHATLKHAATLPGWFVPTSTVLDHLKAVRGPSSARSSTLALELRHVVERIKARMTE